MRQRLIGTGIFLLLIWGCSDTSSFWVTIRFPDQQSKDEAKALFVFAIEPSEGSNCQALLDGSAEPNDTGYIIEDSVDISMPATEGGRPLEDVGPGERLFFAQATDQQDRVFLRGCTSARAGGKGVQTVVIELIIIPECNITRQGVEWCDGLDNDCDGETDEECTACQANADCVDADSCLQGTCTDGICSTDPSSDGTACDDGLYCTETDQCSSGACAGTARDCSTESDDCNQGTCDENTDACVKQALADGIDCEDGLYCTTGDTCDTGACQGGQPQDCSALSAECVEGICDEDANSCEARPMQDNEACDDGEYCTVDETCISGACQGGQPRDCSAGCVDGSCNENQDRCTGTNLPAGTACDDGRYCTENDACDGQGACLGDALDCSGLDDDCNQGVCDDQAEACVATPANQGGRCDDGAYCTDGDACDAGVCTAGPPRDCSAVADQCNDGVCRENQDRCQAQAKPAGEVCDDNIACTSPDECDGSGSCAGVPDDTQCSPGEYCRPTCASSQDGCMSPPTLMVDCPDAVSADQAATCTITAGLSNQEDCITCVPHLLPLRTPIADFSLDSQPTACDLDGWQLETGDLCLSGLPTPACPLDLTAGSRACCDVQVCPTVTAPLDQRVALEFNELDCANEGWRLYRYFDLRGFDSAEACMHFGHVNGNARDIIQVHADDGTDPDGVAPACMSAVGSLQGAMAYSCVDLAGGAVNWPQTRVTFWLHSDTDGHAWILDDVQVRAEYAGCQPTTVVAFSEDFTNCPATLTDGWNGWSVTGTPACDAGDCTGEGLEITASADWTIEHTVDTSALTDQVNLCWSVGDTLLAVVQDFEVEINAGTIWKSAYWNAGNIMYGAGCDRICRDLAALDPAAAGNPDLRIRFSAIGSAGSVYIDDISVSGPDLCDATGLIQSGAVTPVASDYEVNVTNPGGTPYQVMLECRWTGAGPEAADSDSFLFRMP
jgi:hypothetical protein